MTNSYFQDQLQDFLKKERLEQITELGRLIFLFSQDARGNYSAYPEGVISGSKAWRTNEVVHRISSLQMAIGYGEKEDIDSFIDGVFQTLDRHMEQMKISQTFFVQLR
ncbi:hypothetical protein [Diaphorobacter caeni]|uniref:hypothetical protein n=1 Tax=Diaphorobacter caeni TaxID=2784387 RepID=UPI0018903736|nr:hypothetical protein [Diaphorobacter caeni]MBF5005875.1 hypothetical protein [Diaphorobacter caeni]